MNKIEEVSRAICEALYPGQDRRWQSFGTAARAAITTMREPTEAMEEWADGMGDGMSPYQPGSPEQVWKAMIDAALKE